MSIDTCKDCGAQVDTDTDDEAYVYVGNYKRLHATICLCEPCRGARIDAADHDAGREFYEEATWFNRVGALS